MVHAMSNNIKRLRTAVFILLILQRSSFCSFFCGLFFLALLFPFLMRTDNRFAGFQNKNQVNTHAYKNVYNIKYNTDRCLRPQLIRTVHGQRTDGIRECTQEGSFFYQPEEHGPYQNKDEEQKSNCPENLIIS